MPRPLPQPTPETQHFWDGTRAGELRLQRCRACEKVYFPPRPFCPACADRDVYVFAASGRATLHSYVINHRAMPGAGFEAPYAIAVAELEEGPRMMTNIVDTDYDAIKIGQKVKVVFKPTDGGPPVPMFTPA